MTRYVPAAAIVAGVALVVGGPAAGQSGKTAAQERDAFFARFEPVQFVIDVGQKEADSLRRDARKYVPVTVKEGGKSYTGVGLHLRGSAGSFQGFDGKPGLTVNMDKFNDDQRWHGLDKFYLANSVQDPSYLSELVCGEMMTAAGVPAARIGHASVTLAGRPRGFYYLKEGYDKGFLQKHFKSSDGNFYDGGFLRDIDQPLQLVSGTGPKDHADLKALVAACREGDHKKRMEKLGQLLDLDEFVSFMVMSVVQWDWDGYVMKPNNYRIYNDPQRKKLIFVPSGMDQMFADPNGPALPGFGGLVARAIIETPEGRRRYWARMREVLRTVFVPDRWVKRLDELEPKIKPALAAVDRGAADGLKGQVDRLRNGIRQRHKSLTEQVARVKE